MWKIGLRVSVSIVYSPSLKRNHWSLFHPQFAWPIHRNPKYSLKGWENGTKVLALQKASEYWLFPIIFFRIISLWRAFPPNISAPNQQDKGADCVWCWTCCKEKHEWRFRSYGKVWKPDPISLINTFTHSGPKKEWACRCLRWCTFPRLRTR